jgi:uncharacterized protein
VQVAVISEPYLSMIGKSLRLPIRRFGPPGAFLAVNEDDAPGAPTLLLPGFEIPEGSTTGDELDVFVYLDSEDRPIATLAEPKVQLGEIAFLEVKATSGIGAFVGWGLPKDLLVPFAEQTRDLLVGDRHPFVLYLDSSGRLTASMRVSERLKEPGAFEEGEWVVGEAWRKDENVGVFVILERKYVGLLPKSEPHALARGASAKFRIARVHQDGRVELSLRELSHNARDEDAEHIAAVLSARSPSVSDKSSPGEIRAIFGLSKKAFKRAVGKLLRDRRVSMNADDTFALVSKDAPPST